jgi:hypothetical protein
MKSWNVMSARRASSLASSLSPLSLLSCSAAPPRVISDCHFRKTATEYDR